MKSRVRALVHWVQSSLHVFKVKANVSYSNHFSVWHPRMWFHCIATINVESAAHCWQLYICYFLCEITSHLRFCTCTAVKFSLLLNNRCVVSLRFENFWINYLTCTSRCRRRGKERLCGSCGFFFGRMRSKHYFCFDWLHCLKFSCTMPCGISCASNLYS